MKQSLIIAIAALLSTTQAIRVTQKDLTLDYEENVQTSEEESHKDQKFNSIVSTHKSHMEENKNLIKEYSKKIE